MWLWTRSRTIDEIIRINKMVDAVGQDWIDRIEELDQSKVYIMQIKDATRIEIDQANRMLAEIKRKMKWTMPVVIVANTEFRELTDQELKRIKGVWQRK